ETSGSAVTGRRTKATTPMNSSTTNSTTGGSGWRMAHAEMFFMKAAPSSERRVRRGRRRGRLCGWRGHLHFFSVTQKPGRGGHHALGPAEAGRDGHTLIRSVRDAHRAPCGVIAGIVHLHVSAPDVGEDSRSLVLRMHRLGDRDRATG